MLKQILTVSIVGTLFAIAGCAAEPESEDVDSDIEDPMLQPEGDNETKNGFSSTDFGASIAMAQQLTSVAVNGYGFYYSASIRTALTDPVGARAIPEIARCILPAGTLFYAQDNNYQTHEIKGEMGLAPEWANSAPDSWVANGTMNAAERKNRLERVSACVLALVNGHNKHVPITMNASFISGHSAPEKRALYSVNEVTVYGNIFPGNLELPISYFVCAEDPMTLACDQSNTSDWLKDRICGSQNCNIYRMGKCSDVCPQTVPGQRACQDLSGNTYPNAITVSLPRTSFVALNPTCTNTSALDYMNPQCADGSVEYYSWSGIYGCAGKETYTDRGTLCGLGYKPATAADWHTAMANDRYWHNMWGMSLQPPTYHFWSDDNLKWDYPASGAGPANCSVSVPGAPTPGASAYSCGADPMRICKPPVNPTDWGATDPLGNSCNWSGCGLNAQGTNDYFGGCGNPTAGAICKPQSCSTNQDCGTGKGLVCSYGSCQRGCNVDSECPSDSLCVSSSQGATGKACEIVTCDQDSDCTGSFRVCNAGKHLCEPGCHTSAQCNGGYFCIVPNGQTAGYCTPG